MCRGVSVGCVGEAGPQRRLGRWRRTGWAWGGAGRPTTGAGLSPRRSRTGDVQEADDGGHAPTSTGRRRDAGVA